MAVPFIVTASVCTLPPLSAVALTSTVPNNDVSATRVAAFQLWICSWDAIAAEVRAIMASSDRMSFIEKDRRRAHQQRHARCATSAAYSRRVPRTAYTRRALHPPRYEARRASPAASARTSDSPSKSLQPALEFQVAALSPCYGRCA